MDFAYEDSRVIYDQLSSGETVSDIYYMVRNFQTRELEKKGLLQHVGQKPVNGVAKIFRSDPYFVPLSWYPWGFYYNRVIFEKLGLEEPESWEDFIILCRALRESGYAPFSLMTKVKWPSTIWFDYIDLMLNGADFHEDLLAGAVPFTDERVYGAFNTMWELHGQGFFHMDSNSFDWTTAIDLMEDETTAMALSGSFFYESASTDLQEKLGWFPFPDVKTMVISSSGFVVPAAGEKNRGVKRFLRYIQEESGQSIVQSHSSLIPVNSLIFYERNRPDIDEALDCLADYDSYIPSLERNTHEKLITPLKNGINRLYAMEDRDRVEQILKDLEDFRISQIKD